MTRQQKIEFLGKHQPSKFNDKKNFLSYFIIPMPHKVYDFKTIDEFLNKVDKTNWKFLNKQNKRILDEKNELKKHIYESFLPFYIEEEKESFFIEKKHFLLRKEINKKYDIINKKTIFHNINLKEIDLWILEENISFFVLKFEILLDSELKVNDLSIINRTLRDFRNLKINDNKIEFIEENRNSLFINWLLDLTKINNKYFLNITKEDLENDKFYPIYNSSYYAKFLTAIHINIDNNKLSEIEDLTTTELKKIEIDGTDTIEEMTFLLATTSTLYPSKNFEANENYINEMVTKGGINIWKYWSGIALKDSLAFFSVNEGGGMIISTCRDINYFIYILNLYLNYSVKLLEDQIAKDKHFFDIEKSFKLAERLQLLKNLYMNEELAIKFQPNEIHQAILRGLETKKLLEEVQYNVEKSYDRSKDNTGFLATLITIIIAFAGLFVSQDEIRELIHKHIVLSIILFTIIGLITISLRRKLIGWISKLKIIIPYYFKRAKMYCSEKCKI